MRMKLLPAFIPTLVLALLSAWAATAGPYFNSPRTDVAELSQKAVKNLNDARIIVIMMLSDLDEGRLESATERQGKALTFLNSSYEAFVEIEKKVPSQPLAISPRSAEERQVYDEFFAALERRKIGGPKTEKDLAHLAVQIVSRYRDIVSKADLRGFPKNWRGVRQIILSEIELLEIGNLVSVVWTISR